MNICEYLTEINFGLVCDAFCVKIACSPHACVGFLPQSNIMQVWWIRDSKLTVGVNSLFSLCSVCVFMSVLWETLFVQDCTALLVSHCKLGETPARHNRISKSKTGGQIFPLYITNGWVLLRKLWAGSSWWFYSSSTPNSWNTASSCLMQDFAHRAAPSLIGCLHYWYSLQLVAQLYPQINIKLAPFNF